MHPVQGLATILLAHNPLSSLAHPVIPLIDSNLPTKTLVATNKYICGLLLGNGPYKPHCMSYMYIIIVVCCLDINKLRILLW